MKISCCQKGTQNYAKYATYIFACWFDPTPPPTHTRTHARARTHARTQARTHTHKQCIESSNLVQAGFPHWPVWSKPPFLFLKNKVEFFLSKLQIRWRWYADVNSCGIVEKLLRNSLRSGGGRIIRGISQIVSPSLLPLASNNSFSASATCFHIHNNQFQTEGRASQFLSRKCTISLAITVPEQIPVGHKSTLKSFSGKVNSNDIHPETLSKRKLIFGGKFKVWQVPDYE